MSCHNATKKKGDLDLSRRESALAGGESGPAIISGKPLESLLYKKIAAGKMPPKGALLPAQIAAIKKWIEQGAAYHGETLRAVAAAAPSSLRSMQPIVSPTPPRTRFDDL